ncbi:MAG: DNA polymerase I [Prevotellaceae bacterium]|nr:DNA polymerase I [Prevotellaceae bacterium]
MKKLILIDAYAMIYRAYYGLLNNPRRNSKGENTSAVFGFVNTLNDVLHKMNPDYIGVAFDPTDGTFRMELDPNYKAQREKTPEDIKFAVPIIKDVLKAYNIPIFLISGYEADDVIGTLAEKASRVPDIETFMMTLDKDYGQLVKDNVKMLKPQHFGNGFDILGPKEVCEKHGINNTLQVIDLLGLMGDASDNVPGCPGVGPKTATQLIAQFGSIENLLQNTDKLKGALKMKIESNIDNIHLSKKLVTIVKDVPVDLNLDELKRKPANDEALAKLFDELEFFSLKQKLIKGKPKAAPPTKSAGEIDLFSMLESDEQTDAKPQEKQDDFGDLPLFAQAVEVPSPASNLDNKTDEQLQDENFTLIGYDLKKTIIEQKKKGKEMKCGMFDIMLANYVINSSVHYPPVPNTDETRTALEAKMKQDGVYNLFHDIEMPLMPVLADMEMAGVKIDTESLAASAKFFNAKMNEIENEIRAVAGGELNISSPKQIGELLFDKLKIVEKAKKTKTGQYVTSEEELQNLKGKHPVVEKILDYRGYKKLLSTYIDSLPKLINPATGHIHTSFNQAVTATGRLSSSNPNLQNIPIRDDNGKEVRKAFIPDDGCLFFSADYSQIELRIMAHLSGDENLIEAFREGHDIHAATAAKVFKKPMADVTADERRKAKTANFGIIYGITTFGLAERMQVSRGEAKELIDEYFATYPKVKAYMETSKQMARDHGYAVTMFGRRCYLPDINSQNSVVRGYAERNAINAPIQGTAADIIKIAMIRIHKRFAEEGLRSKMILQVHDELNFNVYPEEREKVETIVRHEMESACEMSVPLIADAGWGKNWLEAH